MIAAMVDTMGLFYNDEGAGAAWGQRNKLVVPLALRAKPEQATKLHSSSVDPVVVF